MKQGKDRIITLPNKHLRQKSKKVGMINDDTKQLIDDMITSVIDWDASRDHEVTVALAAIQIDVLLNVIIVRDDFEHGSPAEYTALINPVITKYEGDIELDYEGCLSIKSVYGLVPRHSKVRIKATSVDGKEIKMKATGFLARVLQHEVDHTKGKLFVDHIKGDENSFYELTSDGKLEKLDYQEKIKDSKILW